MTAERDRDVRRLPSLLTNISWLGAANVIVKPFWFLFVTAACMRLLGVKEYGVMNAALSLTIIVVSMTDLGTSRYTVREVAREPGRAATFFSNFIALLAVASFVAWMGAVGMGWVLDYSRNAIVAVVFAGLYAVSLNLTNYCRGLYQAFEDLRRESIMLIAEKVLVISLGLGALWMTRTAHWTLAGMGVGMAFAMLLNIWWIDRRYARFSRSLISGEFLVNSLKTLVPFGLAALFIVVYFRVDMVMIEAMLGETPTGQYGAAFRILEALNVLPQIIATAAVYPRMARLEGMGDLRGFLRLLTRSAFGLILMSLAVAFSLFMTASLVISLLDPDPAYGPAADALRILVWSFPFSSANTLLFAALIVLDDQKFLSWSLLVTLLTNVGMNLVLIPTNGIEGAAIATVLPEIMLTSVFVVRLLVRRSRGFPKRSGTHDSKLGQGSGETTDHG